MAALYIIGMFIVIWLLVNAWTIKCPNCKHRIADEPIDTYYIKKFGVMRKVSVYYCEKCKTKFEK